MKLRFVFPPAFHRRAFLFRKVWRNFNDFELKWKRIKLAILSGSDVRFVSARFYTTIHTKKKPHPYSTLKLYVAFENVICFFMLASIFANSSKNHVFDTMRLQRVNVTKVSSLLYMNCILMK